MDSAPRRRVAILGCGLIGGSLLRALHEQDSPVDLLAVDPDVATRRAIANELGVRTAAGPDEHLSDRDLVVLAQPLPMLLSSLEPVARLVRPGTLITDVSGLKAPVLEAAQALPPGVSFIGGHPMAGKERGGWQHADGALFRDRVVAVCPPDGTTEEDVHDIEALWTGVGARTVRCTAEDHDEAVARVSHLPYLAAASVMQVAAGGGRLARSLAAGGLRDTTRVCGDRTIRHVAAANPFLPALARELAGRLVELAEAFERGERPDDLLDEAAAARNSFYPRQT